MIDSDTRRSAKRRLAIIGCGSSGLISLKTALDTLPNWEIVCFEGSDRITGCWGDPPAGFCSTSTKYTTQFACYPLFGAGCNENPSVGREEFFRDDEYGKYLQSFADHFRLREHIRLRFPVTKVSRNSDGKHWSVELETESKQQLVEYFDAVIVCTGLAAQAKSIDELPDDQRSKLVTSPSELETNVLGAKVVVIGGGESAVDFANRLAKPQLQNETYLSLRSGVRVSPRYHPVRGVPSDFLRNRLMLSIDPGLRNRLGEVFVRARIRFEKSFERFFAARKTMTTSGSEAGSDEKNDREEKKRREVKRYWAMKLTVAAKDRLFNMFHNKSDDFLDAVAEGRLRIVGPPADSQHRVFHEFDSNATITIDPDRIVPAVGYRSTMARISDGEFRLADFYQGCVHVQHENLFAVGYARPVIGNIPSISEMQARYVCAMLSHGITRPDHIVDRHRNESSLRSKRYGEIDLEAVYPVEMFPYCDFLARQLDCYPSKDRVGGWRNWWRMQLVPASTVHYDWADQDVSRELAATPIHLPKLLVGLLLCIKPIDWIFCRVWKRRPG